jgi:hypothetical protein
MNYPLTDELLLKAILIELQFLEKSKKQVHEE